MPGSERTLTVYVEGRPQQHHLGFKVRHAIGSGAVKLVEEGEAEVRDGDGNRMDVDGALYDGERLHVIRRGRWAPAAGQEGGA